MKWLAASLRRPLVPTGATAPHLPEATDPTVLSHPPKHDAFTHEQVNYFEQRCQMSNMLHQNPRMYRLHDNQNTNAFILAKGLPGSFEDLFSGI
jgi:hypothetical protein